MILTCSASTALGYHETEYNQYGKTILRDADVKELNVCQAPGV